MMNAFCASENFDAFIAFRSSQPGKLARNFPVQNEGLFRERINASGIAFDAAFAA
jgi:hypothetical protein